MKQINLQKKSEISFGTRICMLAVLLTLCVSGFLSAQNTLYSIEQDRNEWFIGLGLGPRIFFADHARQLAINDRISGGADIYLGKWWGPVLGTRVGGSWQILKGATKYGYDPRHNPGHAIPEDVHYYLPKHRLFRQQFDAWHLYADILLDVSSIFEGVNTNRFWTLAPFVGLGYINTWDSPTPSNSAFTFSAGLLNKLRVGNKVDLVFDLRGTAFSDHFKNNWRDPSPEQPNKYPDRLNNDTGNRSLDAILSFNIGVEFRFGGNVIPKPVYYPTTFVEPVPPVEYPVEVITEWKDVAADVLILFRINESVLLRDARVQLGFLAKLMHDFPESRYVITGYADEGTGNQTTNYRLSTERANRAKDCLVNEFGIAASRLETVAAGGVANQYYNDPALSRSVVIRPVRY